MDSAADVQKSSGLFWQHLNKALNLFMFKGQAGDDCTQLPGVNEYNSVNRF